MALGILPPDFPNVHHCQNMIAVVHGEMRNARKENVVPLSPSNTKKIAPLKPDQVRNIENAIKRIDQKAETDVKRIRQFLCESSDVMVSSLGEAAGSMTGFGPIHYEEPSNTLCRELVRAKMMVRCPENTEWCAPAHFVPKPDLMHQILPESQWFAKLDAVHGYFQIPLDEASSYLCAFLLPDGKYRPLVAPMGWKGSGDVFSLRTDLALIRITRSS